MTLAYGMVVSAGIIACVCLVCGAGVSYASDDNTSNSMKGFGMALLIGFFLLPTAVVTIALTATTLGLGLGGVGGTQAAGVMLIGGAVTLGAACVCVGLTTCKIVFCEGTGWWYDGEPNSDDNGCSEGFCDFCSRLGDCCSRLDDRLEDCVNLVAGLLCYPRTLWRRRREVRRRRELEEVGGSAGEPTSAQAIAIELEAQEPGEAAIETAVEAGVVALLERAVEAGLTDMEAVGRMLENMRTGRFTPQHYMAIWEPRL